MTYDAVNEFEFGKSSLRQARQERDSGQTEDARSNYNSAIDSFKRCQKQHCEAEDLLAVAEQELQALEA